MSLADIARHLIGCLITQLTRVQNESVDVAGNAPGMSFSPSHMMLRNARNEGSKCVG